MTEQERNEAIDALAFLLLSGSQEDLESIQFLADIAINKAVNEEDYELAHKIQTLITDLLNNAQKIKSKIHPFNPLLN